MDRLHLLEAAQWVALGDELVDGALVERARDQQDDVVDHVAVRDKVQEGGQGLDGMIPQVLELNHELLAELVVDGGHRQRGRLVGQELAVVRALQVQLQVCKGVDRDRAGSANAMKTKAIRRWFVSRLSSHDFDLLENGD